MKKGNIITEKSFDFAVNFILILYATNNQYVN